MAAAAREYFTVDLRGLRDALAARAAEDGVTESDVLRSALVTALGTGKPVLSTASSDATLVGSHAPHVKASVRLIRAAAHRLDRDARCRPVAWRAPGATDPRAPPVLSSADRVAACAALNSSSEELAVMSRDINHLTQLLRQGSAEAARFYAARHETLDRDVRSHLALAAAVLADLSTMRLSRVRKSRQT